MFNVKVQLPSGKSTRIPELKNRDFFSILKFCENEDIEGLSLLFNDTLLKGCKSLDIIDKFYILILIRMVFVEPEIFFEDSEQRTINYSVQNILDKIELFDNDLTKSIHKNKFTVELGMPSVLYFENLNDIYLNVIKSVTANEQTINFTELTTVDKENILDNMPSIIFNEFNDYIAQLSSKLESFVIVDENSQFNLQEININILSNGVINFIMLLYSSGLSSFFDMMYIFTKKLNFTLTDFYELTPLDSKVIYNIYQKELKEAADEALKNQQQK